MSKDLRESVSALMDGEATELELRRVLRADHEDVNSIWARYHRQRDAMRGEANLAQMDISGRVRQALASERALPAQGLTDGLTDRVGWRRALAGLAVAASVAAVVVFGAGGLQGPLAGSEPRVAEVASEAGRVYLAAPEQATTGTVAASTGGLTAPRVDRLEDDRSRERFQRYLRQHTERAALNSGQGMATYARLASHEGR